MGRRTKVEADLNPVLDAARERMRAAARAGQDREAVYQGLVAWGLGAEEARFLTDEEFSEFLSRERWSRDAVLTALVANVGVLVIAAVGWALLVHFTEDAMGLPGAFFVGLAVAVTVATTTRPSGVGTAVLIAFVATMLALAAGSYLSYVDPASPGIAPTSRADPVVVFHADVFVLGGATAIIAVLVARGDFDRMWERVH